MEPSHPRGIAPIKSARPTRRERIFALIQTLLWAAGGGGFTCLMTALGASTVFFLGRRSGDGFHRLMLGFAAGVMLAASVWSLLLPAIDRAEEMGLPGWLPAAGGFALGCCSLMGVNPLLSPSAAAGGEPSRSKGRCTLLILAITIHNIPEGMAVGAAFSLAAQGDPAALAAAGALALGIGVQNFPEGAAISLPLAQEGISRPKAFAAGVLSGLVEPVCALLTVLCAGAAAPAMPWLFSFAAGAMVYVAAEELIPQSSAHGKSQLGTLGVMAGFLMMMVLDVALG